MSTPSIPGVDRSALVGVIRRELATSTSSAYRAAADAALAYIAAHHECAQPLVNPAIENGWLVERLDEHTCAGSSTEWPYAHEPGCGSSPVLNLSGLDGWQECDREHADEWVEVEAWADFPEGALVRQEWKWDSGDAGRFFVHRDDLPDDPADRCPHSVYDRVDGTTSECSLPSGHAPTAHDSGDGVLWTDGEHWKDEESNLNDLPDDPRALIARELGAGRADTFLGLLDEHGWTVTRKGER